MLCVWSIGCHCIECSGHKCAKFDALSDIVVVDIGSLLLKFVCKSNKMLFFQIYFTNLFLNIHLLYPNLDLYIHKSLRIENGFKFAMSDKLLQLICNCIFRLWQEL